MPMLQKTSDVTNSKGKKMYKLLNWIFGWNYLYWENTAASGIARIRYTYNGEPYFNQYSFKKVLLPSKVNFIIYLTCEEIT